MPTKFDDAIAALKAEHYESPEQLQILELLVAQNERIKNLEHFHLEAKSRLGVAEAKQVEHEQSIASLAKTRDEHEVRVKTIEDQPEKDKARLDDLDKRITTVEGAVGSKAYRRAENRPANDEPAVDSTPKPPGWQPPNLIGDPAPKTF